MKKIFTALICCLCLTARANADEAMQLVYDVYLGGLKGMTATVTVKTNEKTFEIETVGKTLGFIDTLYPLRATYTTKGIFTKSGLQLTTHANRKKVRSKTREMILEYNDKGVNTDRVRINNGKVARFKQPENLQKLSKDALDYNAIYLEVMRAVQSGGCNLETAAFSGKKNTSLSFKDEGDVFLPKNKMTKFFGNSRHCLLSVGGSDDTSEDTWFWKTSSDGTKEAVPVKSWFREIEGLPLPVLIRAEHTIDQGVLIVYLTSAKKI